MSTTDIPRNVEGILEVVRRGLCHGCGACVGICPAGTLEMNQQGYPRQIASCVRCNRCMEVCSGLRVDSGKLGRALFGDEYSPGELLGTVREARLVHAADPQVRWRGASGGAVTALLVYLLESGRIDAALVSRTDPDNLYLTTGYLARTPEEIVQAAGSHYPRSCPLAVLNDLRNTPLRLALVGLPCQIHAVRMAQQKSPPEWRNVEITIGLFCHFALPTDAPRDLVRTAGGPHARPVLIRYRDKLDKGWPQDGPSIRFADGRLWRAPYLPSELMTVMGHLYPLGRCLLCVDATAELADLSVGDPWIRGKDGDWKYADPAGHSVVLVRTATGGELLRQAEAAGALRSRPLDPKEVLTGQYSMITEKKRRVPVRLRLYRWMGVPVPEYSPLPPVRSGPGSVLREMLYLGITGVFRYTPLRRLMLKVFLTRWGQCLVMWQRRRKQRRAARRSRPEPVADSE